MTKMESRQQERHKEKMIEIIDINRSKANKVTMIKKNMNKKVKTLTKIEIIRVEVIKNTNIAQNDQ
jgi:hypothetical protein